MIFDFFTIESTDHKFCQISLTNKCNLNCSYCREYYSTYQYADIDFCIDTIKKNNIQNIFISGNGEQTLHKDLYQFCIYLKNLKRIFICTNGTADLEFYNSLLKNNNINILFSYHSIYNDIYNIMLLKKLNILKQKFNRKIGVLLIDIDKCLKKKQKLINLKNIQNYIIPYKKNPLVETKNDIFLKNQVLYIKEDNTILRNLNA